MRRNYWLLSSNLMVRPRGTLSWIGYIIVASAVMCRTGASVVPPLEKRLWLSSIALVVIIKSLTIVSHSAMVTWIKSSNAMPATNPLQSINGSAAALSTSIGVAYIDTAGQQFSIRKGPLGLQHPLRRSVPNDLGHMVHRLLRSCSQGKETEPRENSNRSKNGRRSPPSSWANLGFDLLGCPLSVRLSNEGLFIHAASSRLMRTSGQSILWVSDLMHCK